MAFKHITLAMDLSLAQPGFSVLAITDEGYPIILETSHVKTNAKKPHGERLIEIADEIERLLHDYNPQHVVREKGFSRFPAVTQALFKVVGVSDYVLCECGEFNPNYELPKTIDEIAVTSVKKLVTGNGKASKSDVEKSVRKRLQIDRVSYFANDDESDAAAVGLAYYVKNGLIEEAGE